MQNCKETSTFLDVWACGSRMIDLPKASFVLQTDYEGQAKKLLELMENTDVIIVAGGDGTLQEVWLLFSLKPF